MDHTDDAVEAPPHQPPATFGLALRANPSPDRKIGFEQVLDESLKSLRAHLLEAHYRASNANGCFLTTEVNGQGGSHRGAQEKEKEYSPQVLAKWASIYENLFERVGGSATRGTLLAKAATPDWVLHRVWASPSELIGAHSARVAGQHSEPQGLEFDSLSSDKSGVIDRGHHCMDKVVVHPESVYRYLWALVGTAFLINDAITIPMELVELYDGSTTAVALGAFVYWIIDLAFQMMTGFHENGVVEMKFMKTSGKYLRTWCAMDVAILTIDLFFLIIDDIEYLKAGKGIRMVRNIRMLRLARVGRLRRLGELINSMSHRIFSEYVAMLVRISQLIVLLVAVNHYVACIWYGLGISNVAEETWLTAMGFERENKTYLYALSLHWSLTQFAPATNNIAPQNPVERMFAIGVVMFALVYFSSFISSVTNSVNQLKMYGHEKLTERGRIREFIARKTISRDLGSRIQVFFDKHYAKVKRPLKEQDIHFFKNLPETLRIRMHEEVFLPLLLAHQPFTTFARVDMDAMTTICHEAIDEKHLIPQEDVFVEHMVAKQVRIVVKGELAYFMGATITDEVSKYSWVSEQALYVHWLHCGKLTAGTSCELAEIDCEQFHKSVARHGGAAFRCFQLFATFFGTLMDEVASEGFVITDLDIGGKDLQELAERSIAFYEKLESNGRRPQLWFGRQKTKHSRR